MTTIISEGRLADLKSYPLPRSGQLTTAGPTAGSVPLLSLDGITNTYERMVRQQPWLYTVIAKLTWNGSRLPLNPYEYGEDGESRKRSRGSDLDRLMRRPRPRTSAFSFKSAIIWDLHVHGHALVLKSRSSAGAPPDELWNVPWTNVQTVSDESGIVAYKIVVNGIGTTVAPTEVIHYSLPNGISPIEVLRRTLALEDASMTFQGQSFLNGITPRGAFVTDQRINEASLPRLREELSALYAGPDNAGRFGVFDQGLRWAQMGSSAADAQLIEQRKLSREEVCAVYDVPPPLVGILDRATFSNVDELHKALYVDALGPRLTLIEETTQAQLVEDEPAWDGLFVEFNMDALLRPDTESRARAHLMSQQAGVTTVNERRKLENLPPIDDPAADTVLMPLNMSQVGEDYKSKIDAVAALIRAGFDPHDALSALGLPDMAYLEVQPITVRPTNLLDAQTEATMASADTDTEPKNLRDELVSQAFSAGSGDKSGTVDPVEEPNDD